MFVAIFLISAISKSGNALSIFFSINILDLKKGPKNFKSLLEKFQASLSPKILNTIKNIKIMKNCTKYLIDFIF
jgi:hypothetical protein